MKRMSNELEAVVWCPLCREEKGEIYRAPTGNAGVFTHRTVPEQLPKTCACGTNLERKP
jgi:hypothetical protein